MQWDLTDLYSDDASVLQDLQDLKPKIEEFKLNALQKLDLHQSITAYEKISETLGRAQSYAYLQHIINIGHFEKGKFYQKVQEICSKYQADLVFFTHSLADVKEDDPTYKAFLDKIRLFKNHRLSKELEAYAAETSITGKDAWIRLYDETEALLRYSFKGEEVNSSKVIDAMGDPDPATRKEAALSLSKGLNDNIRLFAYITNTLAKDKGIDDHLRKFDDSTHSRHLENMIEPEVVAILVDTVKKSYQKLSHRYYRIKAQIFGVSKIEYWDRNAPLFTTEDTNIPYEQAKTWVHDAYFNFSPTLAKIVQQFFDHAWIDVLPGPNKGSGAFAHPTVPSVHPYILLNYQGKVRDVMTLAHELGHGAHMVLAAPQGYFLSDTPLTVAETASIFGEMLSFEYLKNILPRKTLLASKIDDMLNSVVRQIAFYEFERLVHHMRKTDELAPEIIAQFWRQTQTEALGPHVNLDEAINPFWAYIGHFIHTPFYVYAYAFGDCLVNSLYTCYKNSDDKKDFESKYLDLLKAGGSKTYKELLKPFGLDPTKREFWESGLQLISDMIDELEKEI